MNAVRVNAKSAAEEEIMKTTITELRQIIRKVINESNGDEVYDQNRVNEMILFLDEADYMEGLANDEYALRKRLQSEFPEASEGEITAAIASAY